MNIIREGFGYADMSKKERTSMEMEETVNLQELLGTMIRAWKGIFVTMLIFALLLGGYQAYRQFSLVRNSENSAEKIEERYQDALKDYETEQNKLQRTLKEQEESLASKEEYLEKSILFQIAPFDEYVTNIIFTFSDIDESAEPFRYANTAADYLPKKIRSQYIALWNSMDVPKDIGIAKYADVEWKYLSDVISVSTLEGELVSIQALGATASDAEELASAVYRYFGAHRDAIAAASAQHALTLVSRVTKNVIDENLITKKEKLETEIDDLKEDIEETQQTIDELKEPERGTGYSTAVILKAVVKYVIIGAIAGMFLACLVVVCKAVFANRAMSSFHLERISGANFLGSLQVPHNLAERLSCVVMGERYWENVEQAAAYITEQARVSFPRDKKVLLLSTLLEKRARAGMEKLVELLSKDGYAVLPVLDAAHNPKAVETMQSCVAVVFVEMIGYSNITTVRNCAAQAKDAEKQVLGFVTI